MALIGATDFAAFAQVGRGQAQALARQAAGARDDGSETESIRDVIKLSDRALAEIAKAQAKAASLNAAVGKDASKLEKLQEKIFDRLEKLVEKAAKAGITIVIEEDVPEPAPQTPAPAAPAASGRERVSAPAAGVAPSAPGTPQTTGRGAATNAVAASPVQAAVADTVQKLTGLERAAVSGNGRSPVKAESVAVKAGEKATGQARAAEVKADRAAPTEQADPSDAAAKEETRVVVIKASVIRSITSFEDLARVIGDTEKKVALASREISSETVARETAETVIAQSSIETADESIRALKAYKQIVDLMQADARRVSSGGNEQGANPVNFAA